MAWLALAIASFFEIVWAVALKQSDGFTRWIPATVFLVAAWLSFAFLSHALKSIPMGSAYAVWTGTGAVGIALVGMIWFGEPTNLLRIACILLIVVGIVGLKLLGSTAA